MKRMYVYNVEIRIEETLSLLKAQAVIEENAKVSVNELALLLTGSKKSWIYQLLFFIMFDHNSL